MPKIDRTKLICCAVLALITLAVYWPVIHFDFTNYDDTDYVVYNAAIHNGVTTAGVEWALKTGYASNWHPLTWISHMVDCGLYGMKPGGHHLTNLLFHTANTVLLFLVLCFMTETFMDSARPRAQQAMNVQARRTSSIAFFQSHVAAHEDVRCPGMVWRSAFVAALFAWHPLHVESVAWACERKDVLSAFFWMLALIAYTRYGQEVTVGRCQGTRTAFMPSRVTGQGSFYYWLALFFFACGLMSKPMVVTLPFVLLLLDFWPLNRFSGVQFQVSSSEKHPTPNFQPSTQSAFHLIREKLPFLGLALAGSVATYFAQKGAGAVWSLGLPIQTRLANALVSYLRYISKTFWPVDLAVIYPYPRHWPVAALIGAALALAIWTGLFLWRARRNPYLIVGWIWFLGTLLPVIGLVQVGSQSMADRYTYIPLIGVFISCWPGAFPVDGQNGQALVSYSALSPAEC